MSNFKVITFRGGPATNSSSSHSIILWPKGKPLPAERPGDGEYGWNHFTLTSKEEKENYLKLQRSGGEHDDGDYIDHQSVGLLSVPQEVQDAFDKFYFNDRVVVLGGNDNDDDHELFSDARSLENLFNNYRKEPWGWTFFNPDGGVQHLRIAEDGAVLDDEAEGP